MRIDPTPLPSADFTIARLPSQKRMATKSQSEVVETLEDPVPAQVEERQAESLLEYLAAVFHLRDHLPARGSNLRTVAFLRPQSFRISKDSHESCCASGRVKATG